MPAIKLSKSPAIIASPEPPEGPKQLSRIESIWWNMDESYWDIKGTDCLIQPAIAHIGARIISELRIE